MFNVEYLSLPSIPENFHESIINAVGTGEMLECFTVPDQVKSFVAPLFPEHYKMLVQAIYIDLPIHRDFSRNEAYNFLIELGGSDPVTNFFDGPPDYNTIEQYRIENYRWHRINTSIPHNVVGIESISKPRICITVYEELKLHGRHEVLWKEEKSIDGYSIVSYPPL